MFIRAFTARNYLIHKTTALHLSPITVFVGQNGGGKSAFFDAILNFSMVARGNIRQAFSQYPYSFNATKHHGAGKLDRIGFDVVMSRTEEDAAALRYRVDYAQLSVAESPSPNFQIKHEVLEQLPAKTVLFDRNSPYDSPLKSSLKYLEDDRGIFAAVRTALLSGLGDDGNELVAHCATEISRFNRFRLNPFILAGWSRVPEVTGSSVPPRLGHEGEDLAACLYYMQETNDVSLQRILERVQAVLPGFQKFEINSVGTEKLGWSMQFADDRGVIPSVRVSHGLLLFVGLMTLCYTSNRPPVMLIEEPENGLTPTSLREFYRAARELAFREDKLKRSQVLISSHSPFIICDAWNGEDKDFIHQFKVEDGHSVVRRFSEVIKEQGIVLGKDDLGKPTQLGLRAAELLMSGYLS